MFKDKNHRYINLFIDPPKWPYISKGSSPFSFCHWFLGIQPGSFFRGSYCIREKGNIPNHVSLTNPPRLDEFRGRQQRHWRNWVMSMVWRWRSRWGYGFRACRSDAPGACHDMYCIHIFMYIMTYLHVIAWGRDVHSRETLPIQRFCGNLEVKALTWKFQSYHSDDMHGDRSSQLPLSKLRSGLFQDLSVFATNNTYACK